MRPDMVAGPIDRKCSRSNSVAIGPSLGDGRRLGGLTEKRRTAKRESPCENAGDGQRAGGFHQTCH